MKSLYGVWKPNLYDLTPVEIMGVHALRNDTNVRIVHSPSTETACAGLMSHEVAAEPGEVICYVMQDHLKKHSVDSRAVVGTEEEVAHWVELYFFKPFLSPKEIDVRNGYLEVLGVPIVLPVLKSYPDDAKRRLREVFDDKILTDYQRKIVQILLPAR